MQHNCRLFLLMTEGYMEYMNSYNFSKMQELLQEGWTSITFTKKDGTSRTLVATVNLDLIPESAHPKPKDPNAPEKPKKAETDRVYNVYDREVGWRSFRESQVTAVAGEVVHRNETEEVPSGED